MPRPKKMRRVCSLPRFNQFGPINKVPNEDIINLTIEEFEVIRLMDLEGLDQEKCAEIMEVARSTIQRMYNDAKQKVADSLVNGKTLKIEGGNYILCDNNIRNNKCSPCFGGRHRHGRNNNF